MGDVPTGQNPGSGLLPQSPGNDDRPDTSEGGRKEQISQKKTRSMTVAGLELELEVHTSKSGNTVSANSGR